MDSVQTAYCVRMISQCAPVASVSVTLAIEILKVLVAKVKLILLISNVRIYTFEMLCLLIFTI